MASKPGIFTDWPWKKLGNFMYVILAPWVAHSLYTFMEGGGEKDLSYLLLFPFLLWRWLHSQLWISFARFQTAKRKQLSPNKSIEFEQVDRERNWDDQIILLGLFLYVVRMFVAASKKMPLWRADGAVITVLLHTGPVEFLYYWLHRALHHHYLYSRYHSHHHSSIATEPITSVTHPFMEMTMYFTLLSIPWVTMLFTGTISVVSVTLYTTYIDFMNNLGHCNFEIVPKSLLHLPLYQIFHVHSLRALINKLIEKANVEAEVKGVKVMTLGLLNQREELNKYGDLYLEMYPKLKIRIVDGSSLAAAVVINSIPEGTKEVLVQGKLSKTGYLIAQALCKKGLQVNITSMDELVKLKQRVPEVLWNCLACSNSYTFKVWLTGNGLTDEEQYRAPKGTYFIPFSQFPLKKLRKDCSYSSTPALVVPKALQNMHSC